MVILGLDPGLSTGFAIFDGPDMVDNGVIPGGLEGFWDWMSQRTMHDNFPPDQIICERYVPLEGFRGIDQTYSLEVQGAIRTIAHMRNIPVTLQLRSDKATLFGQSELGDKGEQERREWLEERGLTFEAAHDMDAATHVLVSQKRARDMDFWNRYWA